MLVVDQIEHLGRFRHAQKFKGVPGRRRGLADDIAILENGLENTALANVDVLDVGERGCFDILVATASFWWSRSAAGS